MEVRDERWMQRDDATRPETIPTSGRRVTTTTSKRFRMLGRGRPRPPPISRACCEASLSHRGELIWAEVLQRTGADMKEMLIAPLVVTMIAVRESRRRR